MLLTHARVSAANEGITYSLLNDRKPPNPSYTLGHRRAIVPGQSPARLDRMTESRTISQKERVMHISAPKPQSRGPAAAQSFLIAHHHPPAREDARRRKTTARPVS